MKIYISGPMSGIEDLNRPAFSDAAEALRGFGHEVFNPAEPGRSEGGFEYREYLEHDCAWIFQHAEALVRLRGADHSKGASAELAVATAIGLHVYYETADGTFIGDGTTPLLEEAK